MCVCVRARASVHACVRPCFRACVRVVVVLVVSYCFASFSAPMVI